MTKCKDGRKHVIVSKYQKKDGAEISRYERSCPAGKSNPSNDQGICCVCGEECNIDDLHEVDIRSETKKICNECVDTIHGPL
jgi:hypothetical protein